MAITLILHNIRSNENVGSIFRTADATGVEKIILTGYTPAPLDRFGRENKGLAKSALGAEMSVPWGKGDLKEEIERLKVENYKVIAIEQNKRSIDYKDPKLKFPKLALVFGNEVSGLNAEELSICDLIAEIPMKGGKESLNVAVSAGVVLYQLST